MTGTLRLILSILILFSYACSTNSYIKKAQKEYYNKNYSEALLLYDKVLDIDSTINVAHLGKGITLARLDKTEEAFRQMYYLNSLNPDSSLLYGNYFNLGLIHKESKEYDSAIFYFKKIMIKYPDVWKSTANLAESYILSDDTINGYPLINEMINNNPKNPKYLSAAGYFYYESGKKENGISLIKDALKIKKNEPLSNYFMSLVEKNENNLEKACGYFNKAIRYGLHGDDIDQDLISNCKK